MDKEQNVSKNGKVREYSILRIIATILVVVGHSVYIKIKTEIGGVNYQFLINSNNILSIIWDTTMRIAVYHMPLFFMLSGAVYHLSEKKSLDELVEKKAKRLILPYVVYGLLFMLPIKIIGDFYQNCNWEEILKRFILGGEAGHLWFLPALFWTTIAFFLIRKMFKNRSVLGPLVVSFIIQQLFIQFSKTSNVNLFLIGKGMTYIFWYALGYAFDCMRQKYELPKKYQKIELLILILICIVDSKYKIFNNFFVIIVKSLTWFNIARLLSNTRIGKSKCVDFLEKNTMYIYLFHDPLEYIILKFSFKYNVLNTTAGVILYVFLRIIGVIIVSILLGYVIDRIKKVFKSKEWIGPKYKVLQGE